MPTYDIQNTKTGEVKEIFCSYKDKDKALKEQGPDWTYMVSAPEINYGGVGMSKRLDGGFKDVLSRVKANSGKSRSWRKNTVDDFR
jgi:hypothetical protein